MGYSFNPFTATLDNTGPAQKYSEFVFNSSGSQSGNRFNTWADLINVLGSTDGKKRVTFEQAENIALGTGINLDDVTLNGSGTGLLAGGSGPLIYFTGGTISSWTNARIEGGLAIASTSSSYIIDTGSAFGLELHNGSIIGSSASSPFFNITGGTTIINAYSGSFLAGASLGLSTLINMATGTVILVSSGGNSNIESNIVTGSSGTLQVIVGEGSSADINGLSQSGFSGTRDDDRYSKAVNIKYDDTNIQTPTSGLVQADNVQEVIDDFITIFGPYVTTLFGRVPPSGGTTGQVLSKASNTSYDYAWVTPTGGGASGYEFMDYEKTGTYVYVGYEEPGGAWFIYRRTISTNLREYATGASGYATAWTNRASESYS